MKCRVEGIGAELAEWMLELDVQVARCFELRAVKEGDRCNSLGGKGLTMTSKGEQLVFAGPTDGFRSDSKMKIGNRVILGLDREASCPCHT